MRQSILAITVLTVAVGGSAACATKGYVNTQVTQVGDRVDSLSESLEETQERVGRNTSRIEEVNQRAESAEGEAREAGSAAQAANDAARAAGDRAAAVESASRRIVYEVVLSEDAGNFAFGQADLPDEARARIDEMIRDLLADPQGAYFEIEGHTDDVGSEELNNRLGMERAEAVKSYLYTAYQIPLHRMNVISYGESQPVAPNDTREGRAQNRRVVIRVLI